MHRHPARHLPDPRRPEPPSDRGGADRRRASGQRPRRRHGDPPVRGLAPPAHPREGGSGAKEPERSYRTEREWRRLECENLLTALKAAGGKVSGENGAAALLGINPNTLASRLRALGLKKAFAP